jgi:gamma-glutamylcyclotransferase (GGCT)/AIG2-like uncharacterized protein YtfP
MLGMVFLMVNGEAMRGGRLHHNVAEHPFVGEVRTAARYRFFSVRDEFPGLAPAGPADGGVVRGELYDVPLDVVRDRFLPDEPPELELGVIELADGAASLCMVLRAAERDRHQDITGFGGWRAYRDSLV